MATDSYHVAYVAGKGPDGLIHYGYYVVNA
jgi:hypothetical protein